MLTPAIVTDSGKMHLPQLYIERDRRVEIVEARNLPRPIGEHLLNCHLPFLSEEAILRFAGMYRSREGYVIAREHILETANEQTDSSVKSFMESRLRRFIFFPKEFCQEVHWW